MAITPTISCVIVLSLFVFSQVHAQKSSSYRRSKVGLGWGPWTGWSVCSESCGHGTAYRIRTCHTRDRDGNPECEGESKQYRVCINKNCTDGTQDYRSKECSKHNTIYYGRQRYTWVPYINEASPCELSCKSLGYGYYARFRKTVADGVICNDANSAVCMGGVCVKAGCDGILGSKTKLDRCGACAGDGTSCRLVRGIFTRTHLEQRGYNVVATIPAGARSINITEMARSRNFLALSTPHGYFLNGNMRLQGSGRVQGAGTSFVYSRANGTYCPGECLTAPGPLNTSLRVELLYFGRNSGIKYHFTVPKQTHLAADNIEDDDRRRQSSSTEAYDVAYGDTSGGSPRQASANERRRERLLAGLATDNTRDSRVSSRTSRYHRGREREDQRDDETTYSPRPYRRDDRKKGNLRDNSSSGQRDYSRSRSRSKQLDDVQYDPSRGQFFVKGDNGSIQYKHYYHTNMHDNIGDVPMVKTGSEDDTLAENVRKRQPPYWQGSNDVYDDRYAEFRSPKKPPSSSSSSSSSSSRSSTTDVSRSDRRINEIIPAPIRDRGDDYGNQRDRVSNAIPNSLSSSSSSSRRRTGYRDDYGPYRWKISGFTPCTESCGGGLQQTRVVCVKSDSQVEVMDDNCDPALTPEITTLVCNTEPCSARWSVSDWSACSVSCGRGLQKRSVSCKQRITPALTIDVRPSRCPRNRPINRQWCQKDPCFSWKVSAWGECSTHCGFGQRTRRVTCVDAEGSEVSPRLCVRSRPEEEEICDMGSCAQGWFHSRWTRECSAECGRGFYTRQVYCSASDGSSLDEKKCGGAKSKPRGRKRCKASKPCGGKWFAGVWSQCNATCGTDAVRTRDVLCIKRHGKRLNHVVKEHNCDPDTKPESSESCGPFPECKPQWFVMAWSSCSKECDTGVRTREVKCVDATFNPSADCDKKRKPPRRRPCNTQPCDNTVQPGALSGNGSRISGTPEQGARSDISNVTESSNSKTSIEAAGASSEEDGELQRDGLAQQRRKDSGRTAVEKEDGETGQCRDTEEVRWCQLARQARLCGYQHYKRRCCRTCGPPSPHNPHR